MFLGALGPVHTLDDWNTYQAASVFGGFSGNTFIFMKQIMDWFIAQGLDEKTARCLVAETLRGNAEAILQSPLSMEELISTVATKGGITAHGANILETNEADKAWDAALDAIDRKIKTKR
jgi:pyrroline-5-carboxylate reductase